MTPVQIRRHPAGPATGGDRRDASAPRVCDDTTVEVALSVTAGARVEQPLLCDGDDERTGSVTRAGLAVHRGNSGHPDRDRLRDVLGVPFPAPGTAVAAVSG
ncbi:hypothetical protein [Streptomyces griseoviridis]|uniref:hypothetical protein n=1 Tax=Streptomyces griseoviridis TaxID=45398 RepID=UPI0034354497